MRWRSLWRATVVAVTTATLLIAGCAPLVRAAHRPAGNAGDAVAPGGGDARTGADGAASGTGTAASPAAGPTAQGPIAQGPGAAVTGRRGPWAPRPGLRWQIQLAGGVVASGAGVYDLDPFATPEQLVDELHAAGALVMCHLDIGVADGALPDAARLTGDALGPPAPAPPSGRWLDIRRWDLIAPVLADRLDLCRAKGFDAVDADNADGYARRTGLPLSLADQVAYDVRVARLAHAAGLAVGERTGAALAARLQPELDFAVVGGCFARGDCAAWLGYVDQGKAVFDVETHQPAGRCPAAGAHGFAVTVAPPDLGATGKPC